MPLLVPLPEPVRRLLHLNTHPGLMLDKYVASWDPDAQPGKLSERVQRPAVEAVVALSRTPPPGLDFPELLARRARLLAALNVRWVPAITRGPFTLHLARASALENAGICLHPIYGFVYLPGSGVKGLAHAYACEVWLPSRPDRAAAWETICRVFGWAPSGWLTDLASRLGVQPPAGSCAGRIVFHDAWPDAWPQLRVDILNNHHVGYYQKDEPPGDWDSPVPVYFLSVGAGQRFRFALTPRRDDVSADLLDLATDWLAGGLEQLGGGAKTASGHGDFQVERTALPSPVPTRPAVTATLELVSPAFLAGARQDDAADCTLRPASLRGLLRWWWRTLHAGFVEPRLLARLEAAVWGDERTGAALRVTLEPLGVISPVQFDKQQVQRDNRLPAPPNNKTTQGLWYHTFGMDDRRAEGGRAVRLQRWFLPAGSRWRVRLVARDATFTLLAGSKEGRGIPADRVLEQGKAALWLLCRLGGVGAKCRKGFGSFADPEELTGLDLDACRAMAAAFRESCGLGRGSFVVRHAGSPALEQALSLEVELREWKNHWLALDQLGASAQAFAQVYKHRREKQALGLPRRIGHPAQGDFRPGRHVKDRHAAPMWYHLGRGAKGLVLRITAFPACELPSLEVSRSFLQRLLDHLRDDLPARLRAHDGLGKQSPAPSRPGSGTGPASQAGAAGPQAGERVEAELLAERTKKGGWQARHAQTGKGGPIVNSADVPGDKQPGDVVTLVVASVSGQVMTFRWPSAAELAAPAKKPGPLPGGPRGGGRPGKRR